MDESRGYGVQYNKNFYSAATRLFGKGAVGMGFPQWWRAVANRHLQLAKEESPRGNQLQGDLVGSHFLRIINQYAYEIGSDAYYAAYVHWGTQPHWMPRYLLAQGFVTPAIFYGIAARGARPNPWMVRAEARLEGELPRMMEVLANRLDNELSKANSSTVE